MPIAPWLFSRPPAAPRRPEVVLAAFGTGPLADASEVPLAELGITSGAALQQCEVRTIPRAADPAWFDAWRAGSLRAIAERDLGPALAELDRADHLHMIATSPVNPPDLVYLQTAWGVCRYLVTRGASIVLDAHAMTYALGSELPAADAELDVKREVRVIYETTTTRPDHAHALHTRGLRKFGAPDVIALCGDADAALVGQVIGELAEAVARGTDLQLPKHAVQVLGATWYAIEDEHRLADLLQLNNSARVVVDALGHDLLGVVSRIPRAAPS